MNKKAHFIGIAGIGMSAIARLLQQRGWKITGSDIEFYPPASDYLKESGILFYESYRAENIPTDTDLIVIGKNAKLIPEENKEVAAAYKSGKPVKSFAELLGELAQYSENIVIAGSYGKSTITALIAWCLTHAGKDPSYFIGALPIGMKENAYIGKDKIFIIEGDEYPASNTENISKFLYYHPHDVLLSAASHDHVNVFPTIKDYHRPFQKLLSLVPKDGIIIVSNEQNARALAVQSDKRVVTYGVKSDTDWNAIDITYGEKTRFTLMHNNELVTTFSTQLLGKHNVENVVGAAAMLLEKKLLSPAEVKNGIETFRGIPRRLDLKTAGSSVRIYEGFGTSYETAKAAFDAIKAHFPDRRLITVFEPHAFSWRNSNAIHWYDDIFKTSDKVFILEPPRQGAGTHKQLSQEEIVERVRQSGIDTEAIQNKEDALEKITQVLKADDIILLMSSGDLRGLVASLPKFVEQQFPKQI